MNNSSVVAIIVCSGSGSRMNIEMPKQFMDINGKPLACHTIEKFESCEEVTDIIIVTNKGYLDFFDEYGYEKVRKVVEGGNERIFSVYNGINSLQNLNDNDIVLIHDGARPFIYCESISKIIEETRLKKCCVLGVKAKDTIKICENQVIKDTPNRDDVWIAQTPQAFEYCTIKKAYDNAIENNMYGTDDASLVELIGEKIHMVEGSYSNIKITTKEDLIFFKL